MIFNNQYTEPTAEMLSLTSGPKFWRVLSQHGLSSPTTNANTDWSTTGRFTISSAPATPVSITVRGTPGFEYSGAERRVAVQLTAGAPAGGAAVALTSSHPALAPLPATLSMPAGHAWSEIPIRLGQVTSPTVVTLTATLNGVSASNQFTLRPPTLNNEIFQAAPVRATGGATMPGWVDLEGGGLAGPGWIQRQPLDQLASGGSACDGHDSCGRHRDRILDPDEPRHDDHGRAHHRERRWRLDQLEITLTPGRLRRRCW